MLRAVILLLLLVLPCFGREFDPRRDAFAFANETVLDYGVDEGGRLRIGLKEEPARFAHRCLCMVRAAMQFWKFARFDPAAPRLSSAEYRTRLKHLFRIPAWLNARAAPKRIVFPGYADLWSFSKAQRFVIQEEIGAWFPTYIRPGNWWMPCPLNRWLQGTTARSLNRSVPHEPQALFLCKFPSMNHAVLVYRAERLPNGNTRYAVYDPNYPGESARLDYVAGKKLFEFEPRFYWPGGNVRAFRMYISPIQ